MKTGITIGAAIALCSACQAGTPFTVTSASYSVSAIAQGEYNESDSSTSLGSAGLGVGELVSGQYDVDASLSGFVSDFIRVAMSANSTTFGLSTVACSTQNSAMLVFSVPADAHGILRSEGNGGAGWQATANTAATASFSVSLIGPAGVLIQKSAIGTPEVFVAAANLPAGEYTLSVSSTTTSAGDPSTSTTARGIVAGGIRLDIAAGFGPCNAADLAEPFGTLDLTDISAFVGAFVAQETPADLDGNGLYDLADISAFISAFSGGCP